MFKILKTTLMIIMALLLIITPFIILITYLSWCAMFTDPIGNDFWSNFIGMLLNVVIPIILLIGCVFWEIGIAYYICYLLDIT